MEYRLEEHDGITVVIIQQATLEVITCQGFKQKMEDIIMDNSKLILDLSNIKFIDSAGIGVFLSCHRTITDKGGKIKLCNLTKHVYWLFEQMHMNQILDIYNTVDEAILAYNT